MMRLGYALLAALSLLLATAAQAQDQPAADSHAEHHHHDMPPADDTSPQGVAPAPPTDHAADLYYSPTAMGDARKALLHDSGGMAVSMIMVDRIEYRAVGGMDGYHWEGGGFFGGDVDRFAFKTEGEGERGGKLERAELQALYSHAIGPYFDLQAGIRHDFQRGPKRSYAVIGVSGLAPYWFDLGAELFVSDHGDVRARIEASYDQLITQRLILQPQTELNFAAQNVPRLGVGAGLSDIELGLRLRYEITREFAPYVGVAWDRKLGRTADYVRLAGERRSAAGLVAGIRFWF